MSAIANPAQREQLLDRFVESRSSAPDLSDEEILAEVRAVRYANR